MLADQLLVRILLAKGERLQENASKESPSIGNLTPRTVISNEGRDLM
ncbi:hypothetical protein QE357_002776 [Siphonobacter sp. BAB-5404]|nr:hypothetical protein [Siphonobacter sp. SORGH_AS_0500]